MFSYQRLSKLLQQNSGHLFRPYISQLSCYAKIDRITLHRIYACLNTRARLINNNLLFFRDESLSLFHRMQCTLQLGSLLISQLSNVTTISRSLI